MGVHHQEQAPAPPPWIPCLCMKDRPSRWVAWVCVSVCLCVLAHCQEDVKRVGVYVSVFVLDDLCESELQERRHWLVLSWWRLCNFHTTLSQNWAICLFHPVALILPATLDLPLHAAPLVHQAAGRRFSAVPPCCLCSPLTFFLLHFSRHPAFIAFTFPLFYFPLSLCHTKKKSLRFDEDMEFPAELIGRTKSELFVYWKHLVSFQKSSLYPFSPARQQRCSLC